LHDDGDPAPAARGEGGERLAGERVAERLDDGGGDVGDRVERGRRGEQRGVVGQRDDREAGSGMERDARHRRAW
jgi:hypothetical protein